MLPMQKATYLARVTGVSFGTASTGNNQVAVQCDIVSPEEFGGESIAWIGHFTDKTTARTIASLRLLGWTGDDLSELEGDTGTLLPNEVELVCDVEEFEGELQLKVKWVNRPGGGRFAFKEPLTGPRLKAFAAQMKGQVRSAASSNRQTPPASPRQTNAATARVGHPNAPGYGHDDDIPF